MRIQNRTIIFISKIFFIFLFLISMFLFKNVLADDPVYTEDLGPSLDETERNGGKWLLTRYGENTPNLGSINEKTKQNFTYGDFKINEKYNWCEYEYNGDSFVVLAGATREKLGDGKKDTYRHYFKYGCEGNQFAYDIVFFKFGSWSKDETIFKGIILDSTEDTMHPSEKDEKIQKLSAYMYPAAENKIDEKTDFNGKEIYVSDDGTFSEDAKGDTIGTFLLNFFSELILNIADAIQLELEAVGTNSKSGEIGELVYSRADIEKSEELQKDLQLTKAVYDETNEAVNPSVPKKLPGKYPIQLPGYILNQAGFEELMFSMTYDDIEIPYTRMDLYTITRTDIDLLDIGFFDTSNNNENGFWKLVRDILKLASKAVLYISAALVLVSLIWRSVMLVISSISQNPEKGAKAKRKINSLIKNIGLLVLVYYVMASIIYLYQYLAGIVMVDKDSYFVFRLTLEGVVSFNTNVIGYIKFITLTTNGIAKFFNSLLYLFMVILDLVWFVALIIRMLLIALFIVVAPLTAIFTVSTEAVGQEREPRGFLHFYNLFVMFTTIVFLPMIVFIAERIITIMLV